MSLTKKPAAGVVGAGIAGLSAAIALSRAGWDVQILEKSHLKNEVGAAITIMAPAAAILRGWGFDFQKAGGMSFQRITISHATNLAVLSHNEFTNLKQQYGEEAFTMHRADLHDTLRELAIKTAEHEQHGHISIELGQRVVDIDCEQGILTLGTGAKIEKDLLVIADGAHSQLFSQFTGQEDQLSPIGRSLYRALLQRSRIDDRPGTRRLFDSSPTSLPGMCMALDPAENTLLVTYACREGSLLNIAIVHDTTRSMTENPDAKRSWQADASKSEALELLRNFHPDLRALLELTDEDEIKVHHHMHRPPLQSFVRGKAVLIGDSAHLMMPTHAAGASMAVESAGVLEVLMRSASTPSSSFPPTLSKHSLDEEQRPESIAKGAGPTSSPSSSTRDLIVGVTKGLGKSEPIPGSPRENNHAGSLDVPGSPLIDARVARSLTLFDSLRIPRCTAFQILSNGGFQSQADPSTVEKIRRNGFDGWLPNPTAGPWSEEFLKWYFEYDAVGRAQQALAELSR